jgi:hypothetical protein
MFHDKDGVISEIKFADETAVWVFLCYVCVGRGGKIMNYS